MDYSSTLAHFNISSLNKMQKETIDAFSKSNEIVLISPTGSGKTLAYLLPLLNVLEKSNTSIQVLILVPTRELAIQIEQVFKKMNSGFKINSCYGGHSIRIEERNLVHPPAVLVGTPGRIAHLLRKCKLNMEATPVLILDEFDKSLEFGFKEEMEFIINKCLHLSKRILTSATTLKEIPDFVGILSPMNIHYSQEDYESKATLVLKTVRVKGDDKLESLMLLLAKIDGKSTLVFCNHRDAVNRISEQLVLKQIEHGVYHGGLEQIDREKTLIKLRNGSVNLLITTDLASRGLDIPEIEVVIHYQMPLTEQVMIHRNGRTARMNASGVVYFLLDKEDYLPDYLKIIPQEELVSSGTLKPKKSEWKTLYLGAGRKEKISKMDVVGFLLQKGKLQKDELGKIEVLDHSTYAAIKADKIENTLHFIQNEKIKNKKIKTEISS